MAVFLVPGVFGAGGQILDRNGNVASGALLTTFAAGTTSTVQVFTTSVGNVAASNPIVTNADGRLPYELWQTGGQAIKITLTDANLNSLGIYDNLTGINDPSQQTGVALLNSNNVFTGQINTFTNITANAVQVTSVSAINITASSLTVSTLVTANTIQVTSLIVNSFISTLNVSTLSVVSITAGNVPLARLSAAAANSGYPQSGTGGETLRIIRGNVGDTGTISAGTGFSVIRNSVGNYSITFTTAFSSAPTTIVDVSSSAGTRIVNTTTFSSTTGVTVTTFDGGAADLAFMFIAIGPA